MKIDRGKYQRILRIYYEKIKNMKLLELEDGRILSKEKGATNTYIFYHSFRGFKFGVLGGVIHNTSRGHRSNIIYIKPNCFNILL